MAGKLTIISNSDVVAPEVLQDLSESAVGGVPCECLPLEQTPPPFPGASASSVSIYGWKDILSEGGLSAGGCAEVFDDTGWCNARVMIAMNELRADRVRLNPVTSLEYVFNWPNIVRSINTKYVPVMYDHDPVTGDMAEIVSTDYTVDYLTGTVTLVAPLPDGHVLRGKFYWLDTTVCLMRNSWKRYTQRATNNDIKVFGLLNPAFELWDAGVPEGWAVEKEGSVSSEQAQVQGSEVVRMTANGADWCGITQQIQVPDGIEKASFAALVRCNKRCTVGIKMGEGNWQKLSLDTVITTPSATEKYIMIVVESLMNSCTDITVGFWPQVGQTDTGWMEVEMCALFGGES